MSFNLGAIRAQHRRFIEANRSMIARAAAIAAKEAIDTQQNRSTFVNRTNAARDGAVARVVTLRSGRRIRITNRAKHARFLEGGTRAHVITARRGRVLRFMSGGGPVFRRSVQHPGTRAYKFIQASAKAASLKTKRELEQRMRALASQF